MEPPERPLTMEDDLLPELPQKRPDALYLHHDGIYHPEDRHDGRPDLGYGPRSKQFHYAYLASDQRVNDVNPEDKKAEESDPPVGSASDDNSKPRTNRGMTRQQAKQLDRELPWRQIIDLPEAMVQKYLQAIEKESLFWLEWRSIEPLTHEQAQAIYKDPRLRRRVLKSRAAYRDKNRSLGEIKAKCRIVALGHQDPDLFHINREAPTPGRVSEHILFQFIVSGMNKKINMDGKSWTGWLADASTAFLQGSQPDNERQGPLYLLPPDDPLIRRTPYWKAPLYRVRGNIYGLPNAPHLWCVEIIKRLSSVDYVRLEFDKMVFLHYDQSGDIDSIITVYVDDFLGCFREDYDIKQIHKLFKWGDLKFLVPDEPYTFKGKELTIRKDPTGKYTMLITMAKFISGLEPGRLPRGRLAQDEQLQPHERAELRSVGGCLQWAAAQARPEVSATVSLKSRGSSATIHDLNSIIECLNYIRHTEKDGIVMQDVPIDKESVLLTYTDASWGNAEHSTSQLGVLVTLTTKDVLTKQSPVSLMDWRSCRSPRVCW